jgi:hypothetical protein
MDIDKMAHLFPAGTPNEAGVVARCGWVAPGPLHLLIDAWMSTTPRCPECLRFTLSFKDEQVDHSFTR